MKKKTNYIEILQMFCTDDPSQYDLSTPYQLNGFACATNGHLAALIPADLCKAESKQKVPNVLLVVPKIDGKTTHAVPLSALQDAELDKSLSQYEKYATSDCPSCKGDGSHRCSCGNEHECWKCDGSGRDSEKVFVPQARLFDRPYGYQYLTLIRKAFEALGVSELRFTDTGETGPGIFESEPLKVALMPLRDPVDAIQIYPRG